MHQLQSKRTFIRDKLPEGHQDCVRRTCCPLRIWSKRTRVGLTWISAHEARCITLLRVPRKAESRLDGEDGGRDPEPDARAPLHRSAAGRSTPRGTQVRRRPKSRLSILLRDLHSEESQAGRPGPPFIFAVQNADPTRRPGFKQT